ncbi:DUF3857 domain-containing protein [Pontimicrobium sp. IMCC45349]|uniref:DUF3857 domain-containing protein n=1 Tax=Pontimicrobium sp. IMCC45349 TaxID=3391574 RepID=UPI0039A2678F
MKKIFTLILTLFVCQFITGQDYKFGKVSKEELETTKHQLDSTAGAAVLYRSHKVLFEYVQGHGFKQRRQVHERIKIYSSDGYEYANKSISLYKGDSDINEKVNGLKAYTYNLEGGKIVTSKLKKDQIFDEENNKYWRSKKFTLPNIKDGCIVEYKYEIESGSIRIKDILFQNMIPIDVLEVEVQTPEYFTYKTLLNPMSSYIPVLEHTIKNGKITLTQKSRSSAGGFSSVKTNVSTSSIDYVTNVISSREENIPALKDERFIDNLSNYQSKLILELNTIEYPQEPIVNLASSWEKVVKTIFKSEDFGSQLKKESYYQKDLDVLLTGVSNPQTKAALIFNFVKSKVKWNGYHGYYAEEGVGKAYKKGSGNVADINLMLVSMLRSSGLTANPVLVSTKSNGIPILPTRSGFNYVICSVKINGSPVLLDASNNYTLPNILPLKSLNWKGRIIREDGNSDWINLTPNNMSKEITSVGVEFDEDLSAFGKLRVQYSDYEAYTYRNNNANLANEQLIKNIEEDNPELEVSNIEVKNVKELNKPVLKSYEYNLSNAIEEIGDKLYFSPLLFLNSEENPFKEETRSYPIDFVFPKTNKIMVNIKLPEGYVVESMPKSSKVNYNGNEGEFICMAKQNGGMIQLIYTFNIKKSLILPKNYPTFKQFFQAMIDAQQEKIVLKKM